MRWSSPLPLLAMLSVCFAGCSTWGYKMPTGNVKYAPVPARQVEILFAMPTDRKYEQIGICSVLGGAFAPDTDMLAKLRKSAADMGADAVVLHAESNAYVGQPYGGWSAAYPKNRGIAIKYLP